MCVVICAFTDMNTNACDHKKLMLQICMSCLQFLLMNISFVSMTCISSGKYVSVRGFSVAVN
jgi:hypothetical protein